MERNKELVRKLISGYFVLKNNGLIGECLMVDKVLIAYASRTGTTKSTAEFIATVLQERGVSADVKSMESITNLTEYRAVIAGSAIQNRQWLPEANEFIHKYRSDLNKKPLALFTVCMTLAMKNGENYRNDVFKWIAPIRSMVQPISEALFAGALDISKIPSFGDRFKFRLSVLFGVWSEGDHRDWNAIRKWAEELSEKMAPN
jgi:menaquinone-dependent protoporphyrinogen oxidase